MLYRIAGSEWTVRIVYHIDVTSTIHYNIGNIFNTVNNILFVFYVIFLHFLYSSFHLPVFFPCFIFLYLLWPAYALYFILINKYQASLKN